MIVIPQPLTPLTHRMTVSHGNHQVVTFINEPNSTNVLFKLLGYAREWNVPPEDLGYVVEPNPYLRRS